MYCRNTLSSIDCQIKIVKFAFLLNKSKNPTCYFFWCINESPYLLELLYLWLLKHGEHIGAGLLSSSLSLFGGLFTRLISLNKNCHKNYKEVIITVNNALVLRNVLLMIQNKKFQMTCKNLPCLTDWTLSCCVMLGWVLWKVSLIRHSLIIGCGGQQSPLHGDVCSLCVAEVNW